MHLIRLLLQGIAILNNGEVSVQFPGRLWTVLPPLRFGSPQLESSSIRGWIVQLDRTNLIAVYARQRF